LVDEETETTIELRRQLKTGESEIIKVDPVKFEKPGRHEKIYRFMFFNEDNELVRLKPKCGYNLEAYVKKANPMLTNFFRQRVQTLAQQSNVKEPLEFLIEKLR